MTSLPLSVVVPARNEAETIGAVVRNLLRMDWVSEVVVVDNASDDGTAAEAVAAGARSVHEDRPGMGHAVRAGLAAATHDWVMKVDADLEKFNVKLFSEMVDARSDDVGLIKGDWTDPKDNMPMTRLLVKPGLAWLFPGLAHLRSPNTGIYLVNRSLIAHQEIVGDYAADLDIMVRVYAAGAQVIETDIGRIEHDMRSVGHYNKMAETIMGFLLSCQEARATEEIVVLATNAEDVLQGAFGLCVMRAKAGGLVSIFLKDATSQAADVLRQTCAAWPTVSVLPMSEARDFALKGPEKRLQLVCTEDFEPEAHHLQRRLISAGATSELMWAMATSDNGMSDQVFDIAPVRTLKQQVLNEVGLSGRDERYERFRISQPSTGKA